ncbi:MAG TPA: DNA cytosine methyltransferase [Nitrososphaera sp.]|nr:DNA cytosine methyltransferase [Nitrososphaera sp.]
MDKLKVLDLFSGIGGFSLGLERTGGFETIAFCEIEPYCQKVLKKHWPDIPIYDDVRKLNGRTIAADVVCGGFPCPDISIAGKQAGIEGERSGLWKEQHRIIGEVRPRYAIVENVTNLLAGEWGTWFGRVLGDLAEVGYDAEWHCIPASAVGSFQERDRIWIVAYPFSEGRSRLVTSKNFGTIGSWRMCSEKDLQSISNNPFQPGDSWPTPLLRRMDDGVPSRVDRIKGLGNAVVPQIPELIGRAILEAEKNK